MPELFKLIKKKFSKIHGEWQWTYSCLFTFTFQKRTIKKITITDHPWRKKGREKVTKELILNICRQELNGRKNIKPSRRVDNRNVYVREWIPYGERDYLLVFWFEDYNPDWIWIRNCYPLS
ncbi:MAG: hypothetical protein I3273_02895 [Candidatus Moeniiplasma glomeromycotorum]|nr:hypothetical protein [Candidatus Moeniiplasma glomeromycotorum]MCE8167597.1 hypothetical protein [Candidatus Moeniiplasma glomeromycotorum]MCE8169053.1 hypothetical protein [Candidatus Moeniiplasma glomeromycotorum]